MRERPRARWAPYWTLLATLLLAAASPFALTSLLTHRPYAPPALAFDPAQWRAADGNGSDDIRGRMVRDLLRHHLKRGMTAAQVESLLGPAQEHPGSDRLAWCLGSTVGYRWGIDPFILSVQLDTKGRVAGWRVYEG